MTDNRMTELLEDLLLELMDEYAMDDFTSQTKFAEKYAERIEQAIAATLGAVDVGALQAKVKAQSYHINKLRGEYKALDEQMERRCAEYRATIRNLKAELDAATLGGGKLTAEQVRETIERHFGRVAVLDDGKPVEWRDDWVCKVAIDYRAIADELNTRAERTCENVGERCDFACSECGARLYTETSDGYTMILGDEETILLKPNYCPNCGRWVVR